ncbi:MAG TPA: EAL domain-containing protein [Burkholderiales bacterium]|nr:EAL domain-containing protein [Burkholderiales bacterium]
MKLPMKATEIGENPLGSTTLRPKILVADDNSDMRDCLYQFLAPYYEVIAVADGEAALTAAWEQRPDLVLTDVMMPRLDGFGLLRRLRADERTCTIPVVLLSARTGEDARMKGLEAGADEYLIKPFNARELLTRVESELRLARLRRENEQRITGIIEGVRSSIIVFNADWQYVYLNGAIRQLFKSNGIDADSLIGKHIFDAFPDFRELDAGRAFAYAMTKRVPMEREYFYEPFQQWYHNRYFPMQDGGLMLVGEEITERKWMELNIALLADIANDFARLSTAHDIAQVVGEKTARHLNLTGCYFAEIDDDLEQVSVIYEWREENLTSAIGAYRWADWVSDDFREQNMAGITVAVDDVFKDPRTIASVSEFASFQCGSIVQAPSVSEGRWKYLLIATRSLPSHWRNDEIKLLSELANRIWLRLERARTQEALEISHKRFGLLAWALERLTAASTSQDVREVALATARQLTDAEGIAIVLRDGEQCYCAQEDSPAGPLWQGQRFPLISCVSGWAMLHNQTAVIENVYTDDRVPREAYKPTFVKSMVMVPVGGPEPFAAIGAYWSTTRRPDPEEVTVLEAFARAVGTTMERRNAEERLRENEARYRALAKELTISNERFKLAIEASGDGVWDWNMQTNELVCSTQVKKIFGLPEQSVLDYDTWINLVHPEDLPELHSALNACLNGVTKSLASEYRGLLPDGSWKWLLARATVVTHDENKKPLRMAGTLSDISEKRQSDELIRRHANFDTLTGLPNRRLFRDRLDQEVKKSHRTGLPVALLFIDLDHFKEANDLLGHDVGDLLLIEAAKRISACLRESDTIARLGGDEFTAILADLYEVPHVESIAQKIIDTLSAPFRVGAEIVHLSASIGITLYPTDASNVEDLMRNADQAMYAAKNAGRNQFSYFTPIMQQAAHTRLRLIGDLRNALSNGQLEVHYQPIIDLFSGDIVKAEALLRWHHPLRGSIDPRLFIPFAEESGLINEIGDWVFKEAAACSQQWSSRLGAPFQISVNKSPVQFLSRSEETNWLQHLETLGLPGSSISVEITEGVLLNASASVTDTLLQYRDAGIQVAIDDFGTGYSSMAYLRKFDIDYLKIDQSFIADMAFDAGDRAIVRSVVAMAHELGLKVIAEGIETPEQKALLIDAECDFGQGFLFSKPVSSTEFERVLMRSSLRHAH